MTKLKARSPFGGTFSGALGHIKHEPACERSETRRWITAPPIDRRPSAFDPENVDQIQRTHCPSLQMGTLGRELSAHVGDRAGRGGPAPPTAPDKPLCLRCT